MEHILPYLVIALTLSASLLLFLSLKGELHAQGRKQRRKMEALIARLAAAEQQGALPAAPSSLPRSGFNLSRRVQAMRLLRQGEGPAHIAAVLGVPDKEVELLIRVRRMTADPSIPAPH